MENPLTPQPGAYAALAETDAEAAWRNLARFNRSDLAVAVARTLAKRDPVGTLQRLQAMGQGYRDTTCRPCRAGLSRQSGRTRQAGAGGLAGRFRPQPRPRDVLAGPCARAENSGVGQAPGLPRFKKTISNSIPPPPPQA